MKRNIIVAMSLVLLVAFSGICYGGSSKPVHLLMWSGAKPFMDTLSEIEKVYEQETGREVEISTLPWDEMHRRQVITLAAGSPTYDVIYLAPKWLTEFAEAGLLEPLDERMTPEVREALVRGSIEPILRNGRLYSLPKTVSSRFFIYRKDLYQEAGIDQPPRYIEEMVEYSKKIQQLTGGKVWGFLAGLRGNIGAVTYVIALNLSGGAMWDEKGYPAFTSAEGVRALTFLLDIVNKYQITPPAAIGWSNSRSIGTAYNTGIGAQMIEMAEKFNWANNPELSNVVGKSGISINPAFKDSGRRSASRAAYESVAIPVCSENKDAAWHFVKWFTTAYSPNKLWIEYGYPPLASSVLVDQQIQKEIPWVEGFREQISYPCPTWEDLSDFTQRRDILMEEIEAALLLAKSPEQALEDAAKRIIKEVIEGGN